MHVENRLFTEEEPLKEGIFLHFLCLRQRSEIERMFGLFVEDWHQKSDGRLVSCWQH
jgi:hypothetical protein